MATTTFEVTPDKTASVACTTVEASISVYTESDDTVVFRFDASLPAAIARGLPLPKGWSNFTGITGAILYVKAIRDPALVSGVRS